MSPNSSTADKVAEKPASVAPGPLSSFSEEEQHQRIVAAERRLSGSSRTDKSLVKRYRPLVLAGAGFPPEVDKDLLK
jgi:hypothetical protein